MEWMNANPAIVEAILNGGGDADRLVGDTGTQHNQDARALVTHGWRFIGPTLGRSRVLDACAFAGAPIFPRPESWSELQAFFESQS